MGMTCHVRTAHGASEGPPDLAAKLAANWTADRAILRTRATSHTVLDPHVCTAVDACEPLTTRQFCGREMRHALRPTGAVRLSMARQAACSVPERS